jgi:hypothetical protein
MLQSRDESQLHRLALLISSLGCRVAFPDAQPLVRIRLHPRRFAPRTLGRIHIRARGRAGLERVHPLGPPAEQVEAGIGGDLVEPRAKQPSTREPRQAAPSAEQSLLQRVVGVIDRSEHPVAVRAKLGAVRLHETSVGDLVAATSCLEQVSLPCGRAGGGGRHAEESRATARQAER